MPSDARAASSERETPTTAVAADWCMVMERAPDDSSQRRLERTRRATRCFREGSGHWVSQPRTRSKSSSLGRHRENGSSPKAS